MILHRSVTLMLLLGLSACGNDPAHSSTKRVIEYDQEAGPAIGAGYDSLTNIVGGECIDMSNTILKPFVESDAQDVSFSLEKIEDVSSFAKQLQMNASAKVYAGVGSASAKASFLETHKINKYSIFILVAVRVKNISKRLHGAELEARARETLMDPNGGAARFRERCGDEFVIGYTGGGELISIIEISTQSEAHKRQLELALAGTYGMASGSADFKERIERISAQTALNVFLFQKGGDSSSIKISPDELVEKATGFAGEVNKREYPYSLTTASYKTLHLPRQASPIDVMNQLDIMRRLADNKIAFLSNLANVEYVLANQSEFISPDITALNKAASTLRKGLDKIHDAASICATQISNCEYPKKIPMPEISLPKRIDGVPSEAFCKNPIYKEKEDASCGIAHFRLARTPACSVESYRSGTGPSCGAETYKEKQSEHCGVAQYKERQGGECGITTERQSFEVQGPLKLLWNSHEENIAKGNELCNERMPGSRIEEWEHPPRRVSPIPSITLYTRRINCVKETAKTCRHSAFGVESYNLCRHEAHGVETFKTCAHEDFGVAAYFECRHQDHGIEKYQSCRRKEFGFERCAD